MRTPFEMIRRLEDLEAELAALVDQRDRDPRLPGRRWQFLVETVADAADTPTYPTGGDTFRVRFLDIAWDGTPGLSGYTSVPRSASGQAVAKNVSGNFLPQGTIALATFHPPPPSTTGKGKWILSELPAAKVVRFRLTADLSNGGSAAAVLLRFDGTTYQVGAACYVFDWWAIAVGISTRGMWQGKNGMEGIALQREVPSVPGQLQYDIIWMETYAWSLENTGGATALGGSGGAGASGFTTTAAFEQGVDPGTITLHDDQNFFPRSLPGAKAKSVRTEYEAANPYYKALNAQQMVLYGDCYLASALDATDATASLTATYSWWTFSPFNQPPAAVPTVASNLFSLEAAAGSRVLIAWDEALALWVVVQVVPSTARIVQFVLTSDLANGGTASANIISWNGAGYVTGGAITVHDWYTLRGMWQGKTGHEGFAIRRGGEEDEYDVIWMATYAWSLEGTLTAPLGSTATPAPSSGSASASTQAAFEQGINPGTVTVHDDQGFFPRALEGARVKSVRSEYEGVNPYYKTLLVQQLSFYATAELLEPMCDPEIPWAKIDIASFKPRMFSPFNQRPDEIKQKVLNPFHHKGMAGDLVFLVWWEADPDDQDSQADWVIIDVEKHHKNVVLEVYWEDDCLKAHLQNAALEICGPPTTAVIICGEECP